jgi:hypothetical protein
LSLFDGIRVLNSWPQVARQVLYHLSHASSPFGFSLSGGAGLFVCFNNEDWTQSLLFTRQAFYHLSHSTSPSCSGYFWDRVSLYVKPSLDHEPPICAHHIAERIGTCHHTHYWLWWCLTNIFSRLASNYHPLIPLPHVASITGLGHSTWLNFSFFLDRVPYFLPRTGLRPHSSYLHPLNS